MNEQVFYCPYDLAIQTIELIRDSQIEAIAELKSEGYSDIEIDELMK
jgi:hypothetical protein